LTRSPSALPAARIRTPRTTHCATPPEGFNLRPPDLENALGRPIDTIGTGSTLNSNGAITNNLYDHLVIADLASTNERIGPATVLDVRSVAADPRTFFRTVSDHLPIVAKFRVGPDDD